MPAIGGHRITAASAPRQERAPGRWILAIGVVLALGAAGVVGALIWSKAIDSSSPQASSLFVVDAAAGWTEQTGAERWRLHLVNPRVLWFSDRPARGSGMIPAGSLVDGWGDAFGASPPYAAITVSTGAESPAAVQLTQPELAADGTISFTLTPDAGLTAEDADWITSMSETTAQERGRLSLFIDDGDDGVGECSTTGPGGGIGCFVRGTAGP
jgi:hypothetical protein